jgi:hypothetical protein
VCKIASENWKDSKWKTEISSYLNIFAHLYSYMRS